MRSSLRTTFVFAASAALVIGSTGVASADTISTSSTDSGYDAATKTFTMYVGESATVTLTYGVTNPERLNPGGGKPVWGPGEQGCELKGGAVNKLVLDAVAASTNGGALALADPVVFEACEEVVGGVKVAATEDMSFTATAPGVVDVSFVKDAATVVDAKVTSAVFDTESAGFRVIVLVPEDGRDAPAIANDDLHNVADAATLAACQEANGTNPDKTNWHGQLINKIAQFFDGQSFTEDEEYIVIAKVREYCGF